jgi:hypothetical protein
MPSRFTLARCLVEVLQLSGFERTKMRTAVALKVRRESSMISFLI